MQTYNEESVIYDFNRLLDLYLNTNDDKEKANIYSQMLFIYNISTSLAKKNKLFSYKPKGYSKYVKLEDSIRRERYSELSGLTRALCYNLSKEMDKYYTFDCPPVKCDKISYEEYLNVIRGFLKRTFPDDLELFEKDVINGNLILKKDILFSSADIYYLEKIKKYYIMIKYYKHLTAFDIASTIHEYGHASTFIKNDTYNSNDYIMNEVISTLYELMFLDYYLSTYYNNLYYKEIIGIFNGSCVSKLRNIISKRIVYSSYVMSMTEALYGQIIASSIYTKYYDKDILEKIGILKDNYSKVNAFELLRSINITENDLIDTSIDISKLILRR